MEMQPEEDLPAAPPISGPLLTSDAGMPARQDAVPGRRDAASWRPAWVNLRRNAGTPASDAETPKRQNAGAERRHAETPGVPASGRLGVTPGRRLGPA